MASNHPAQKRYPPELRHRAVQMVLELQRLDPSDHGILARVARQLGVGPESLRRWVAQARTARAGLTGPARALCAADEDARGHPRV